MDSAMTDAELLGEERYQAFLERRGMMGAPEPCDMCDGTGMVTVKVGPLERPRYPTECDYCLGTGAQP